MKPRTRSFVVVAFASVLAACGARACGKTDVQKNPAFDDEHRALVAKAPRGVSFVLRTEGDRRRFALGETIALVLRFSSSVPDTYELDLGTWDNSGRLESETLHFDPSTVVDPLASYFEGGRTGGGSRPKPAVLGTTPTEVTIALNEWARFVVPGKYRVFVESRRLESKAATTATSDALELEIVDDPRWAAEELARARSVLATQRRDDKASSEARLALRFLGTQGAARALVDDLCAVDERSRFQAELGLFASPFRRDVVTMLEEGLAASECAVTSSYLGTLGRLQQERDAGARADAETALLANLDKKKGPAATVSVQTALEVIDAREQREKKPDPMREKLRARLAERGLATLPEDALARMLETDWHKVRSAALAPALLELVKEARPRGSRLRSVSDLALERLLELDYDGARTFVVAELGRTDGVRVSFTGKTIGRLEDAELPALDAALLSGLLAEQHDGATLELRSEVLARYASKALVDKVWPIYRGAPYFRISLLSYLARHDARGAAVEMRAIDDAETLRRLAENMWSPLLEEVVVKRLKARDASTAARVLAQHGSAAAETAIVARLREIHASGSDKDGAAQQLRSALLGGRGWMITPDRMRVLAELCDDSMCRSDLASPAGRWGPDGKQPDLVMWSQTSGKTTGWFGHYTVDSLDDVKRRIEQLPAGFTIALKTKPPDVDAETVAKVRAWAAEKKLAIVTAP